MANDGTIGRTMRGPMRVNNAIDPLSTIGGKAAVPISRGCFILPGSRGSKRKLDVLGWVEGAVAELREMSADIAHMLTSSGDFG